MKAEEQDKNDTISNTGGNCKFQRLRNYKKVTIKSLSFLATVYAFSIAALCISNVPLGI